ncbi:sensor histidine kinase [Paenibacillus nasutitermitis]|uniref:histidine kinase n=1 Tax=Paenibacillus nasutitermitis TaxID=1652958 RepID=A0A916Z5T1_9BACL|nr:sensor histidine kinase [Paenibacillus nasutitermitis]GGD76033.1 two-component sensor histidine kinase [Paenibacillus nasutitermitis]
MEFWTICNKSILLLFVVGLSYVSQTAITPWYTLSILLYLSLNVAAYIWRQKGMKPLLAALSIVLLIASSSYVHPLLILLIPVNIYELVSHYFKNYGVVLILMLIPLAFLPHELFIMYGFVALLSSVYFTMLRTYAGRIETYKDIIENMRGDLHQVTSRLNENNEYIKQSEYLFKLEERNRLSQEIHDQIGHSMTGALIQMEAAKRLIATDTEKSAELLQNAIHISKDGIERIRLVLKSVKPVTEQLGINRMKLFIDEFSARHPIKTALTYEGNVDIISPIHWKIIQQNATEALTNTMKYSDADAVAVHIQVLNTFIKVEISDNGKGAPKVIKGLGIIGMEERTAAVNGKVIVDGSRGFSVTTLIPYSE